MFWIYLVRKKSAETIHLPPRHGSTMFADEEHIDEFILEYSKDARETPEVSFLSFENTIVIRKKNCVQCGFNKASM